MIDCEHGGAGPREVEELARAANLAGVVSIVTRYIECGADGVMVPLVSDAPTTQAIVDRLRFSAPFDFADRFVILMIETKQAVDNLPEILKVEGVDAYLVAPGDLALTLGKTPYTYERQDGRRAGEVDAAVDHAIKTIVDAGKVCGTLVNMSDVERYLDKGVRLVYDHANHMLSHGSRAFLERIAKAA